MLDCYNRHAWRRLYTNKLPVTSVYVLNETVLPFFEAMRLGSIQSCRTTCASSVGALTTIPTSCSFNWRGLSTGHKVHRPQIEWQHRTLLDEHFRIKVRTTWYESVEQMQTDLDSYLEDYNTQRPHQGRMMEGQTPYSMFKKGLKLIPKEVRTKVA